jgi:hypothetical protein
MASKRKNSDPIPISSNKSIKLSSFQSKGIFQETYPGVIIEDSYVMSASSTEENLKWIEYFGHRLIQTFSTISIKNESSLYPLIFDILSSVVYLNSDYSISSATIIEIEGDEAVDDTESDEGVAASIYTATENLKIYLEECLRNTSVSGFVEFVIKSKSGAIRALVEAKQHIKSYDYTEEAGFWQLCAEMMAAQDLNKSTSIPVLGIFTDGFKYFFLRLIDQTIAVSRVITPFTCDTHIKCTLTAPDIVPFLLQIVSDDEKMSKNFDELLQINDKARTEMLQIFFSIFRLRAEARAEGIAEGMEKGIAEGIEKGIAEGIEKGKAEGVAEGIRKMVAKLKMKGFDRESAFEMTGMDKTEFDVLWNE